MSGRIKQRGLNEHLPVDSPLRTYLAQKEETGQQPVALGTAKLINFRPPMDHWPKILLVMPPITLSEGTVKRVIPPLGISYIAAYLESQSIPCALLDCVAEGLDHEIRVAPHSWRYGLDDASIRERLKDYSPDIIGLSIIYSSDLQNLYDVARIAKEINPAITVVAGGIHPTIYPEEVLYDSLIDGNPTIDFIIRGEGEVRLADFIRNYRDGVYDRNADGLAGWQNKSLFINPQISTIQDLDKLPFPAYHKLPMEKYFEFNVPFSPFPRGKRVMQIYTSRGCPVSCTFCASTNFNKAFRARSVENVMAEIDQWKRLYSIDEIQFADDNLTLDRQRAIQLFTALKDRKLHWCTPNGIMVNTLSEELLCVMISSGLYQITLSLDSGSAKTLKEKHRKPVDLERVPRLMDYLKERGILIHGTLVIGMPGESFDDIEEGFRYVEKLPFNSIGVFIAQALPGSELYELSVSTGAITRQAARAIDTARSAINLSHISASQLEEIASSFLYHYNLIIRERDRAAWDRKYNQHTGRLSRICIGTPAPNTNGIIRAIQPTPQEVGTEHFVANDTFNPRWLSPKHTIHTDSD